MNIIQNSSKQFQSFNKLNKNQNLINQQQSNSNHPDNYSNKVPLTNKFSYIQTQQIPVILFNTLLLVFEIFVNLSLNNIMIKAHPISNGIILSVNLKSKALLIIRYLNELNSKSTSGVFVYLQNFKHLFFQTNVIVSKNTRQYDIEEIIKAKKQLITKYLHKKMIPIMRLMYGQQISDQKANQLNNKNNILSLIQRQIFMCNQKFQCEFKQKQRLIKFLTSKQILQIQLQKQKKKTLSNNNNKNNYYSSKQFLCLFSSKQIYNIQQNLQSYINQIPNFIRYLTQITPILINPKDRTKLCDQISIFTQQNKINWQIIHSTESRTIFKGPVDFIYTNHQTQQYKFKSTKKDKIPKQIIKSFNPNNQRNNIFINESFFHKILVRKQDKSQTKCKLKNEKSILQMMSKEKCVHLPKFYIDVSWKQYQNSIFLDYYVLKSLQQFTLLHNQTLSLFNKFYIIYQIIQGLRFLRNYAITHNNIQPRNIIIAKNLITRISDFGEATQYQHPIHFETNFIDRLDVYNLGILMHKLLFNQDIIQNSDTKQKNDIQYFGQPQKLQYYGERNLMHMIGYLCLKCLNRKASQRPQLNRLAIIMRLSIVYLDKIYFET